MKKISNSILSLVIVISSILAFTSCARLFVGEYVLIIDETGYVYSGNTSDKNVVIDSMYNDLPVKEIASCAFENRKDLESVEIPDSIEKIGMLAFSDCDSLKSIKLPNKLATIENNLFSECDSLTYVEIPNSVTSIGDSAFAFCPSLTTIKYNGTMDEWNAIGKDKYWDYSSDNYTVYCVDGNISKE